MFENFGKKSSALSAVGSALAVVPVLAAFAALSLLPACGGAYDPTSALGKSAILDRVNLALSKQDCTSAIATLAPVYNSIDTDNRVRMMMASSYGCGAHVNFFKVLGDLAQNSGSLATGLWAFLATEFPSAAGDHVSEAAQLAQDALQSAVRPGVPLLPANLFNATGFNPGALSVTDRIPDANAYLFFISMAGIGALENRYGNPYPNGKKGNPLPWNAATSMDSDGCAYASAIVNFVDSLGALSGSVTGNLASTVNTLQSTFQTLIYDACDQGCNTICGLGHCATCPATLRNRSSCVTGAAAATDPASCAAAGIVNFINSTPVVGWVSGP